MRKLFLFIISLSLFSCSQSIVYRESPETARTAYAIKDSFDSARIDLANSYTDQLVQLVTPPTNIITIAPIIKDGKRIAVIPEKYKDSNVVVVGTKEWEEILKIKTILEQVSTDKENLNEQLLKTREQIREQQALKEKLAADNIALQTKVQEYKTALYKRTAYLCGLLLLIGGYVYLKIKNIAIPFLPI